jgi:hypothetical protein
MSQAAPASAGSAPAKAAAARPSDVALTMSPSYLVTVALSALAALAAFYVFLFALQKTGNLPPPAFTNGVCADEKLEFLRARSPKSPTLLVVGSSVAWRHFDGAVFEHAAPGAIPLNGAFCGFAANQNAFVANWLLARNPSVREVLMIVSPQDFEDCTTRQTEAFNQEDADRFVYQNGSRWELYLRYFSPGALLHNAMTVRKKRVDKNATDSLVFDRYGSWPLENTVLQGLPYGLSYGAVKRQDPACFKAVDDLGRRLQREGRRLMIATTPLHPDWKSLHDPQGRLMAELDAGMRRVPGAEFWNGDAANVTDPHAFWDALHMRWPAAQVYSKALAEAFRYGQPVETGGGPARASTR